MSWRIASSEGVTTLYDERGEAIGRLHEGRVLVHPDHDSDQVTAALLEHPVQAVENQRRPNQDEHQRHEPVGQSHEARRESLPRVGDSVHQVAGQPKDQEGGNDQHADQISSKKAAELDPKCPKCGAPMHWRSATSLSGGPWGLYPEGAWECSNTHCWNMLPPGELAPEALSLPPCPNCGGQLQDYDDSDNLHCPSCKWEGELVNGKAQTSTNPGALMSPEHPDPWMDNEPGSLTLPEHWGAADEPSPINQSMLTLNEVGHDMPMTGGGLGTPFIYDRGTQTVHMGPPESYHADIHRLLQGKLQGPIFHGEHDGGVLSWHTTPNTDERQAVTDLFSRNYGHPFHDPLERGMDEFKLGFFKRALRSIKRLGQKPLRCSACGDVLTDGPDCPRCNWGGWNTSDDAATKNPKDPTVDMHRGIQSSYDDLPYWQRNDEWSPGVEGKGWLGENGVYAWRIGKDRYPRHMDNRFRAEQAVGKLQRPFQISPTGYVYDIGRGAISPEHMDAITYNDPRLHNVANSPEVWGDPETGGEFQLSHHSADSGGWEITADYQGWTNWDTWHTKLMMDNDYDLYQFVQKMMDTGRWKSPEDVRDWALTHVLAPHNKQAIDDAKEWNSIPEDERIDHHFEDLKNKSPEAADIVDGLGFGKDVSDEEPTLMDPEMVNWQEIWQHLVDEQDANTQYQHDHDELQRQGIDWGHAGGDQDANIMRDALYRHHGAKPDWWFKDQGLSEFGDHPEGSRPYHSIDVHIPYENFTQIPRVDWPDSYVDPSTRVEIWNHQRQQYQNKLRQEIETDPRYADMDPETKDFVADRRLNSVPRSTWDNNGRYDMKDPRIQQLVNQDPNTSRIMQEGYRQRLHDFSDDLIYSIQRGQQHPYIPQMQEALTQRGYTPEQQQSIMRPKWQWEPETGRWIDLEPTTYNPNYQIPDNQPSDLTFPADWEAPGDQQTFSRVIPQDRWWTPARRSSRRSP